MTDERKAELERIARALEDCPPMNAQEEEDLLTAAALIRQMARAEPVAEIVWSDPCDERCGTWVRVRRRALPPVGTKLYTFPEADK